jgi:transposase
MLVTAGQRHESTQLGELPGRDQGATASLRSAPQATRASGGRPRLQLPTCRRLLRQRRIPHTIPERSNQQAAGTRGGPRGGRPPLVDPVRYRQGNVVERAIALRKQHRAIATRYDKLAVSYHSWLVLAALLLWLPT